MELYMEKLLKFHGIIFRVMEIFIKTARHPVKIFRMLKSLRKMTCRENEDSGQFLKELCESLGPTFIKFGQILSTRSDILPDFITENLKKLQDNAVVNDKVDIVRILKSRFKNDYEKIFAEINNTPSHCASICLIYEGRLITGEMIVIKLKKPGIEKTISNDFHIFELLAFFFQNKLRKSGFKYPESVNRLKQQIFNEINLSNEIENAKLFEKIFASDNNIKIPRIYTELSGNDFIVMEKIFGYKLNSLEFSNYHKKKLLLNAGARAFLKQIFINGFFHADPHPGNIIFTEDKQIALIDFGIVGRLTKRQQNSLLVISLSILNKDIKLLYKTLINERILNERTDMNDFIDKNEFYMEKYINLSLKEISFQELFKDVFELIREFKMQIPSEFLEVFRCLIILDGVGKSVSPDFNIAGELKPVMFEIVMQKYSLKEIITKIKSSGIFFIYKIMNSF